MSEQLLGLKDLQSYGRGLLDREWLFAKSFLEWVHC